MPPSSSSGTRRRRPILVAEADMIAETSMRKTTTAVEDFVEHIPRPTFCLSPEKSIEKCKISTRWNYVNELNFIKSCLCDDGKLWFMRSQFAHLFDLVSDIENFYSPLLMILSRTVKSPNKSEVWFVINGIPIRYSLMEHALLSGLKCSPPPSEAEVPKGDGFIARYLGPNPTVNILRQKLSEYVISGEASSCRVHKRHKKAVNGGKGHGKWGDNALTDKLKLVLLHLLCTVFGIGSSSETSKIDKSVIEIVENLEFAKTYPWGSLSYSVLIEQVKRIDLNKLAGDPNPQLKFRGFIVPLMIFPFECITALSPKFGSLKKDVTGPLPRISKWITKLPHKNLSHVFNDVLESVRGSKDITSLLHPTLEERSAIQMEGFRAMVYTDADPTTKSWTEILEKGGRIFFEEIWQLDVQGRWSILGNSKFAESTIPPQQGDIPMSPPRPSCSGVTNDQCLKVVRDWTVKFEAFVSHQFSLLSGRVADLETMSKNLFKVLEEIKSSHVKGKAVEKIVEGDVVDDIGEKAVQAESEHDHAGMHSDCSGNAVQSLIMFGPMSILSLNCLVFR